MLYHVNSTTTRKMLTLRSRGFVSATANISFLFPPPFFPTTILFFAKNPVYQSVPALLLACAVYFRLGTTCFKRKYPLTPPSRRPAPPHPIQPPTQPRALPACCPSMRSSPRYGFSRANANSLSLTTTSTVPPAPQGAGAASGAAACRMRRGTAVGRAPRSRPCRRSR